MSLKETVKLLLEKATTTISSDFDKKLQAHKELRSIVLNGLDGDIYQYLLSLLNHADEFDKFNVIVSELLTLHYIKTGQTDAAISLLRDEKELIMGGSIIGFFLSVDNGFDIFFSKNTFLKMLVHSNEYLKEEIIRGLQYVARIGSDISLVVEILEKLIESEREEIKDLLATTLTYYYLRRDLKKVDELLNSKYPVVRSMAVWGIKDILSKELDFLPLLSSLKSMLNLDPMTQLYASEVIAYIYIIHLMKTDFKWLQKLGKKSKHVKSGIERAIEKAFEHGAIEELSNLGLIKTSPIRHEFIQPIDKTALKNILVKNGILINISDWVLGVQPGVQSEVFSFPIIKVETDRAALELWWKIREILKNINKCCVIISEECMSIAEGKEYELLKNLKIVKKKEKDYKGLGMGSNQEEYVLENKKSIFGFPDAQINLTIKDPRFYLGSESKIFYIVILPTERSWLAPLFLNYGGGNDPDAATHALVLGRWEKIAGIEVVFMGDTLELLVNSPLTDPKEIKQMAWEQYLYCCDMIANGCEALINSIAGSKSWYFWWD